MRKELRSAFDPRQYMLSRDFEIFYYSDQHFQSVGSHAHDYCEFYFFVEGAVDMLICEKRYRLRPGDVIVVPPGVRHRAELRDNSIPYRRFVFWLSQEYCQRLYAQAPEQLYLLSRAEAAEDYVFPFDAAAFNGIQSKLFALLDEIHADRFGRDARIALCVSDLLLHLSRSVYERANPPTRQEKAAHYETITAFIDSHLDEPLSLDRLSGSCFLSKYYIAHLFRENTGLSVHQYITKKRLSSCLDAIRSGSAIGAACARSGFKDYSAFYRAFRKEYGVSPSEFEQLKE